MNPRRRAFQAFATAMFLCVFASNVFCLPITSFFVQKKISSGKFPVHSACMMPPQGHLTRIGVKGAEGMTKESEAWAAALENLVESHLKSDGIAVHSASDSFSSGASEDEIGKVISEVQQKFSAVAPLVNKKPGQIAKSAYTLGDQVEMLPCSESSDILIFVQGNGQTLTDNRAAMTLFIGGPAEDAAVFVTMADAKTGEIVGQIRMYPGGDEFLKVEETFGERLDAQLASMNVGAARKKAKEQGKW